MSGMLEISSAIEFAVLKLKVTDIIVCGHSNCGALQALCGDERELEGMPHLRDWLNIASSVKETVAKVCSGFGTEYCRRIAEEENILAQLKNIQTYPFVARTLNEGRLYLHGWYYKIETGDVSAYNPNEEMFEVIVYSGTTTKQTIYRKD
ncbi:MAG: hypothetical protein EPN22_10890 [Nitrospirae bacterium]|nr:MAG: hypothetical protein EPN22_10890 [Nitrospirota bacterium]